MGTWHLYWILTGPSFAVWLALGSDIGTYKSNPKVHILLEVSVHKRVPFLRFFPDSAAGVFSELCL